MYISMEQNSRGNLEIEERILNKIIELDVTTNAKGFEKVQAVASLYQEHNLFVVIKIYVKDRESLVVDEVKLNSIITNSMINTLNLKPKNIAFSFIK